MLILHPYLPISATSPQWPLSSVPKVAFMERFDCIYCYSLDPQALLFLLGYGYLLDMIEKIQKRVRLRVLHPDLSYLGVLAVTFFPVPSNQAK